MDRTQSTTMKLTKSLTWPFLILAFATLMVYLGGLGALQRSCYDYGGYPISPVLANAPPTITTTRDAAFGLSDGFGNCGRVFRFHWFSFAFVCATLLGLMITAAIGAGLHFSRAFWIGMLAVSTILMMLMSEAFLGEMYMYEAGAQKWLSQMRTAAAGAIMTVVGLVLLMLAVGTDWEHRRGTTGDEAKPESGVTTTTTTGVAVPVQNVRVAEQV